MVLGDSAVDVVLRDGTTAHIMVRLPEVLPSVVIPPRWKNAATAPGDTTIKELSKA